MNAINSISFEDKLKVLSEIYQNATAIYAITDPQFNVIWTNQPELTKKINSNRLCIYFDSPFDTNEKKDTIVQASIDNCNFVLSVLPILEDINTVGYVFRFVTAKDAVNHWINKDYATSQIAFFSHLRAQTSGIISAATILHDSLERMELYDDLKILNRQVNYCYKILASLLNPAEISKYAFGLHNIVRINTSIFVKDILQMIGTLLRGNNVTFEFNADEDAFVDVDADRFVVLILNAVVNAIQYNIEEEKVIKISVRKSADSCILSFSDNGVGISEDKMAEIFGTKSCVTHDEQKEERNGLGHRIFSYFCKAFNAVPNITSKENFGTTLSFKMPLSKGIEIPEFAESKITDYLTNRFSNIYVAISDIAQINYF